MKIIAIYFMIGGYSNLNPKGQLMTPEKINLALQGVPQTLLLPLLGRAWFSQTTYSPIYDPQAVTLVQSLNYDFDKLFKTIGGNAVAIWWMARAYQFDEAIKDFLRTHPNTIIINLGAGLDTTFHRINNGKLTWIDLDLPEVIQLRKKLLPASPQVHNIEKSLLDFSWMEDVKKFGNKILFVAGGLFMYFTEEQVKSVFLEMAKQFPQAELIFDVIHTKGIKYANNMIKQAGMHNAVLQWGIEDGRQLESWSPQIKLLSQIPYFKNIKTRYRFPLALRLRMFLYDLRQQKAVLRLKFG